MLDVDVLPFWKGRDARTIKPREVVELLDGIVQRGSRVMANRVAGLLSQMFRFGVHRDLVEASPVQLLYRPGGKERPKDRTLSAAPDRPAEKFICEAWDFAWGQVAARRQVPGSNVLLEKVLPRTVARVIKALLPVQHLAFGEVRGSQKAGSGGPKSDIRRRHDNFSKAAIQSAKR